MAVVWDMRLWVVTYECLGGLCPGHLARARSRGVDPLDFAAKANSTIDHRLPCVSLANISTGIIDDHHGITRS